jgi:energy-coupling factor transporter transmembrane protein EcfT
MTVLFHFLFVIVKSYILALIYTPLIWFLWVLILKVRKKYTGFKWKKVFPVYLITGVLLIIFSFTYYGDHGLGDDSRIPLEHGEAIEQGDHFAYFTPKQTGKQVHVKAFVLKGDNLCMSVDSGYKVYNLKTKGVVNFSDGQMYDAFAFSYGLPLSLQLQNFKSQYDEYWGGWRFWLLP